MRPGYDWFFPYYRDGALMLGLGISAKDMLLQAVGSADDPSSGGRQMPCHWSFPEVNVVTESSATGSQCIPAVGCAEAGRYIVRRPDLPGCTAYGDELTYVSLGEGAVSQGEFWEALNSACTLHLPVLFVVADNGYAISVPSDDQHPAPVSELVRGFRGLAVHKMDGRDYFEVRTKGKKAIERIRAGEGPALLHAIVTRPYSHSLSDDQRKYRTREELAEEQDYDPIDQLERELVGAQILSEEDSAAIRAEAKEHVAAAAAEAIAAPRPDPSTVLLHVTGELPAPEYPRPGYINLTTKSGNNRFHGVADYWHQSSSLAARDFFAARKPQALFHTMHAQVSGPVIKDKTFFFFSWMGQRWPGSSFYLRDVPTASMCAPAISPNFSPARDRSPSASPSSLAIRFRATSFRRRG